MFQNVLIALRVAKNMFSNMLPTKPARMCMTCRQIVHGLKASCCIACNASLAGQGHPPCWHATNMRSVCGILHLLKRHSTPPPTHARASLPQVLPYTGILKTSPTLDPAWHGKTQILLPSCTTCTAERFWPTVTSVNVSLRSLRCTLCLYAAMRTPLV